ncbi:hypothetical protein HOY82DRAFT_611037 [Tuber indicum]|nr:hypothetical protein HOY82DRAFT_611037 [Tuber indicum]
MSLNSHKGTSRRSLVTTTTTAPSPTSKSHNTIPKIPTSFPNLSKALPDSTLAKTAPLALTCPVATCALIFKGEMSHGYLLRHLKQPGIKSGAGDENDTWLQLHKIEYDQLVAAGITPAQSERDANMMGAPKASRAARFESLARNMGITDESLVAQKIAIWEGMYVAEQSGDSIGDGEGRLNHEALVGSEVNRAQEGATEEAPSWIHGIRFCSSGV